MSPRDISPKEQTQEQSETHAVQSSVLTSSAGLTGLRYSLRDISPKGQTQERRRTHAGQPKCSGAVVSYHGSVETLGDISR